MPKLTSNQLEDKVIVTRLVAEKAITSDKLADNIRLSGNIVIDGNLSITGDLSNEDTLVETLKVDANEIVLNASLTENDMPLLRGGQIRVNRGSEEDYLIRFDENDDLFKVGMENDLEIIASRNWVDANMYTHPSSHPPSIIIQDANNRFATDEEKSSWNNKASTDLATDLKNGLMSASDYNKLYKIENNANRYIHPTTDGNKHIPANGTSNNGKYLKSTNTSGAYEWANINYSDILGNIDCETQNILSLSGGIMTGPISFGTSTTSINRDTSGSIEITTPYGYVKIGPQNSSWTHFASSLPFYFNGAVEASNRLKIYNSGTYLTATEGKINNHLILTNNDIGSYSNEGDRLSSRVANVLDMYNTYTLANNALPKSGGTISGNVYVNTKTGSDRFYITRLGANNEAAGHYVADSAYIIHYKNDEAASRIDFILENTDSEGSDGSNSSTKIISLNSSKTDAFITINGSRVLTQKDEGHDNGIDADTVDGIHANRLFTLKADKTHDWTLPSSITEYEHGGGIYLTGNKYITLGSSEGNLDIYVDGNMYKEISTNVFKKYIYESMNCTLGTITGSLSGNASTATTLQTARTIALSGDVTGSASFNGSSNITLNTVIADNSHNHTSLIGMTKIAFNTGSIDHASIQSVISGASTYLDFCLGDDYNQDKFRFRFDPAGGIEHSIMELYKATNDNNTGAKMLVYGNVEANSGFTGALTGNASTSSKWITPRNITLSGDATGSVTIDGSANATLNVTISDDSHSHKILHVEDTREINDMPNELEGFSFKTEFKERGVINSPPGSGNFSGLITFNPWANSSGGNAYQTSHSYVGTTPRISIRTATIGSETWGDWYELYHTGKKPTASDVGARSDTWVPTWNDVTGKPTSMPANGGNSDTVDNKHASDFVSSGDAPIIADLNLALNSGFYSTDTTTENAPVQEWGQLIVSRRNVNALIQMYMIRPETGHSDIYIRHSYSGNWREWSKLWHNKNDGAGSGLDADLLDGKHASEFANSSHSHSYLPLSGGTLTGAVLSNSDIKTSGKIYVGASQNPVTDDPTITLALGDRDTGFKWISDGVFQIYSDGQAVATVNKASLGMTFIRHVDMSAGLDVTGNITASGYLVANNGIWFNGSEGGANISHNDNNNETREGHYENLDSIMLKSDNADKVVLKTKYLEASDGVYVENKVGINKCIMQYDDDTECLEFIFN